MITVLLLCTASFVAGLTDSIVGGGGLVQLPALFIALPHSYQADLLGTNKFSSVFGTTTAMATYLRRVKIDWLFALITAGIALLASLLGAWLSNHVHPSTFKPLLLVMLIAMFGFTFFHKEFGAIPHDRVQGAQRIIRGVLTGASVGFYDGFIGPGTGILLIFLFIGNIGMDFLAASAVAKIVNVATNIGALTYFARTGHIIYHFAIPMAVCNVAGGLLGARLAIAHGNSFVRLFFQVVIAGMIARFAWDLVAGR